MREAVGKADMRFSCGGDLVSVPVLPRDTSSLQFLSQWCMMLCSQNTNIFCKELKMACPVAGMSSRWRNSICSEKGNERSVIPAQNKSDFFLLWNGTFYRLETISLVAEEQWEQKSWCTILFYSNTIHQLFIKKAPTFLKTSFLIKQKKILAWHNSASEMLFLNYSGGQRLMELVASFKVHWRGLAKLESLLAGLNVYLGIS